MGIDLNSMYQEEDERIKRNREKMGDYDNPKSGCPYCGRHRVMRGADEKHRCEKCAWCVEDGDFDYELLEYLQ